MGFLKLMYATDFPGFPSLGEPGPHSLAPSAPWLQYGPGLSLTHSDSALPEAHQTTNVCHLLPLSFFQVHVHLRAIIQGHQNAGF